MASKRCNASWPAASDKGVGDGMSDLVVKAQLFKGSTGAMQDPTWLLRATVALEPETLNVVELARSDSIRQKPAWQSWCYAADTTIKRYNGHASPAVMRRAIGLAAWRYDQHTFAIVPGLYDQVLATPLPRSLSLKDVLVPSRYTCYLHTPAARFSKLTPRGTHTAGVLAYWSFTETGERRLCLLLNHMTEMSLVEMPVREGVM